VKPKILLTGFGPFEGVPVNPTGMLMERIAADPSFFADAELKALALETAYSSARAQFEICAAEFEPDAILSFGVATGEREYRIERIAANRDDCKSPDMQGVLRAGEVIEADGPSSYPSTLPVEKIEAALRAAGISVRISDSAGNYVCNHVFYAARHWAARNAQNVRAGFIHIPDPAHSPDWKTGGYMETLENVARLALQAVAASADYTGARNTK
jgi:pyroglutamyl-peptidase